MDKTESEYLRFDKEFDTSLLVKIEERIDQYKGISWIDDKEYTLKYIQFNEN